MILRTDALAHRDLIIKQVHQVEIITGITHMNLPFNTDHISYTAQERVTELLSPLNKIANIHYFNYSVTYPDRSSFTLHNNHQFFESWFENEFPFWEFHLNSGWYLWETVDSTPKKEFAYNLGIANGIIHIEHQPDKIEVISFATNPDNRDILSFYFNHTHLLKKFKSHFIDSADDLIHAANKQLIHPLKNMMHDEKLELKSVINYLEANKYLSSPFDLLSTREKACCSFLIKGLSLAEMSQALNLALPTVANYVCRLKTKLNIKNRAELVQLATQWGLVEYFDY